MDHAKVTENLDLEYFQKLLLERFDSLQRQQKVPGAGMHTDTERQRIEIALNRIRKGDFWYCLKCGEDITEERLLADPTTLTCVDCAPVAKRK